MKRFSGRALIVDDEHGTREFCRAGLEQLGYHVETSATVDAALHHLNHHPPFDLLLLDIQEHHRQTVFMLKHVRQYHKTLATIAMVADATSVIDSIQHIGAHAVLLKPFSIEQLHAAEHQVQQHRALCQTPLSATQLSQRMLAEKLAGMGRLSASIAHEINNPLQALQSSLNLLVERPLPEEKRDRILHMAHDQVEQLVDVVQHMMDLYRPVAREAMRPVSPHELLESVLAALEPQLRKQHVIVERDWDGYVPRVRGVSSKLKQVFSSLIVNALDAMPVGGRLMLRTRVADVADGRVVQIDVGDTGSGISPDVIDNIFEPFYSTRNDRRGFGLAISYSIVEQHEGMISVDPTDKGTTFTVALPAI